MKKFLFLYFLSVLLFPDLVMALQSHPHPEGLYVHQFGHVTFGCSMLFFLIYLTIKPLGKGKAWIYFKISLVFFILWNINAFFAHWTETLIPSTHFYNEGSVFGHYIKGPVSFIDIAFYILKHDHLWCVPAMFFMVLSLRTFYKNIKNNLATDSEAF